MAESPVRCPRPARAVAWPSTAIAHWQRQVLLAAGADSAAVVDEPFRFLRLAEVERRTGLTRSTIYRKISEGLFPPALPLSPTRAGTERAAQ